ncbi:lantibiotic dehydratase (plasmid) [Kitasatospora sp. NBC_00070]|uniref:lantibiotic dehydratase n=1 Tax=Kitasatospora sp. NBC_00070 TaxID=2975962 RepID=UPI00324B5484
MGWRRWLERAWSDSQLVAAIEVAAGAQLTSRVAQVVAGGSVEPARLRRLVLSVMRYALRAGRATPFGLFAGVAPVRFGDSTEVADGGEGLAVARVDAAWLAAVVRRLEPLLLERLPVVANDLCTQRGRRLVVPARPNPGGGAPVEVSVRLTRAVEIVRAAARKPLSLGALAALLGEEYPHQDPVVVRQVLAVLVEQGVLLSGLRPPMTAVDPLAHVLATFEAIDADAVLDVRQLVAELRAVRRDIAWHNEQSGAVGQREARVVLAARMNALVPGGGQPLMLDLHWPREIVLPERVRTEAEQAAKLLARLTPRPAGHPAWVDFHARYIEHYGPGATVPVTELVNPDTGFGFPARYRDSLMPDPPQQLGRRDARLLALAQKAAVEGHLEVLLDDDLLNHLAPKDGWPGGPVQPSAELTFHLAAALPELLDRGAFTLTVVAAPRAAGTTTGRFLHLLPKGLNAAVAGTRTLRRDALAVQVSAPPLFTRVENVARAPQLLPVLHIGEHPGTEAGAVVRLEELGVRADAHRMWLVRLSDGRPVEPRVLNAIEFRANTQPIVRFLCEITTALTPVYTGFDWGAAGKLPFLPRLRRGRIIVSPARWHLAAIDLPDHTATWQQWQDAARKWLDTYSVPPRVHLTQHDLKLPLDLAVPAHLALLREHLHHEPTAALSEAPGPGADGWCAGRANEITVQLHATQPRLPGARRPGPVHVVRREDSHLPGASAWLYARVYGNPARQDEILHEHLPDLLARWAHPPQWWFLRHTDPQPHLRLRLRLPEAAAFTLAGERVGEWARQLRSLGLVTRLQLDTYQGETGRYGSGFAMTLAETVFAADSRAVLLQLRHADLSGDDPVALAAAGMTALATGLLGDETGVAWLLDHIPHGHAAAVPRPLHQQAVRLADRTGRRPALLESASGRDVLRAWRATDTALTDYLQHLEKNDELAPGDVLPSLLHLHYVRMLGIDHEGEQLCHRLARAAAGAQSARRMAGAR